MFKLEQNNSNGLFLPHNDPTCFKLFKKPNYDLDDESSDEDDDGLQEKEEVDFAEEVMAQARGN